MSEDKPSLQEALISVERHTILEFQNPIIVNGYLYYTMPVNWAGGKGNGGLTVCQDLRTGQIIWSNPNIPPLSFAYIYAVWTPNYHGTWEAI